MAAHPFVVEKVAKQEQTAKRDAEKWATELFSSPLLVIWMLWFGDLNSWRQHLP
jgi:hypothetical protein